jgi:preprotein translocase subunit SecG
MLQVLLVIQLIVALALVAVILFQRSEGGALGIGGGGGMMSARGSANLLTRITTILAITFIGLSLGLTILSANQSTGPSVLDQAPVEELAPEVPSVPEDG